MNEPERLLFSLATGVVVARFAFAFADYGLAKVQSFFERNHPMRKTYGPDQPREIPEVPFSLNVEHEDPTTGERILRIHDFIGRPDPSSGDYARFAIAAASKGGAEIMEVLMQILPRMIANNDGVPAQWKCTPLPRPDEERHDDESWTDAVAALELRPDDKFRGPDGEIYPASERKRFEEFDAGSSRRRLYSLMFEDPDAKVQMQTVTEIMKDLFAEAARRPTSA